jgi:hypothetical protein
MAEQELDLLQILASLSAQFGAGATQVMRVAFGIIWRRVSEIFGVVSDLLYDLRQTGA